MCVLCDMHTRTRAHALGRTIAESKAALAKREEATVEYVRNHYAHT